MLSTLTSIFIQNSLLAMNLEENVILDDKSTVSRKPTSKIIVSNDHTQTLPKLNCQGALVVFDIDDTLFTPLEGNLSGSSAWSYYLAEQALKEYNLSFEKTVDLLYPFVSLVYQHTSVRLTQLELPDIINELNKHSLKTIALTATRPSLVVQTADKFA